MDNIIVEALEEVQNYNCKLIPAVKDTVEHFRAQREDQALGTLIQIIEGLNWEFEIIFALKEVLGSFQFVVDESKINDILREMTGALENQDYVLMADLLEYEILPLLEEFQQKTVSVEN